MANQIHLTFPETQDASITEASWLRVQDGRVDGGLVRGNLQQLQESIGQDELVVYVPGRDVLLIRASLPAGRRSQLLTALPFVLEDNLVDDVDDLHCVLGPRLENGDYVAAVVKHDTMQSWLQALEKAGLRPRRLVPDTLLLPWQSDSWTVHCDAQQTWVRSGKTEGFSCSLGMLPLILHQAIQDTPTPPELLRLSRCDQFDTESVALPDIEWQTLPTPERPPLAESRLDLVLQYGIIDSNLNLLQDSYAPHSRIKQQIRPWYAAAALAGAWLLLGLVGSVAEYYSLNKQNTQLHMQMVKVYQQTFPNTKLKKNENPFKRMNSDMKRLRGDESDSGPGFSHLMAQLAPAAAKHKTANFTQLRYRLGKMELMLEIPDLQSLDALKQSLSKATDWKVELKTANASVDKVQGRIVIFNPS